MSTTDTSAHNIPAPRWRITRYESLSDVPMEDGQRLLRSHGELMLDRITKWGGPWFDIEPHINAFWSGFSAYEPPNGCYLLAHDENGRAVGTAAMKRVSDDTGEMKHLYIDPAMRGTGLGNALVQARIAIARELGLKTLIADTFKSNPELPALYAKIGFEEVDDPQGSYSIQVSPELNGVMRYFRLAL